MKFFSRYLKVFERSILLPYIDAGTGSLLIQLLIGSVAGGFVAFKLYWHNLKDWTKRRHAGKGKLEEKREDLLEQ